MHAVNWLTLRPEDVPGKAEPSDLMTALKEAIKAGPLDVAAQRVLDYALADWTLSALSREADVEGVIELSELAALAAASLPEDCVLFRARWEAFGDLLESKRLAIGSADSGRARNLLHAGPILNKLKEGEIPQRKLREELGLSAPRLSQILAVMEEGRLIRRRKQGKENLIALHNAEASTPHTEAQSIGAAFWRT
jgi:DNA-binding transcriptional ArsR family regulator